MFIQHGHLWTTCLGNQSLNQEISLKKKLKVRKPNCQGLHYKVKEKVEKSWKLQGKAEKSSKSDLDTDVPGHQFRTPERERCVPWITFRGESLRIYSESDRSFNLVKKKSGLLNVSTLFFLNFIFYIGVIEGLHFLYETVKGGWPCFDSIHFPGGGIWVLFQQKFLVTGTLHV